LQVLAAGCVCWWKETQGVERRRKRRCWRQPVCLWRTVRGVRRSRDVEHSGPHAY
ncbi:unnamed protein product, partial [Ectocarpus sp. 12 AP-2014]